MLKKPTVFILGAGASSSYRFPLGNDLLDKVRRRLYTDQVYVDDLHKYAIANPGDIEELKEILNSSSNYTLDGVLAIPRYQHLLSLGKTLILNEILGAEAECQFNSVSDNWYHYFFIEKLIGNAWENIVNSPVRFITFNYDRSLEWFIYKKILEFYGVNPIDRVTIMKALPIVHLHGVPGKLEGVAENGEIEIPFGTGFNDLILLNELKKRNDLRLIHEEEDYKFEKARDYIENSRMVVFLGNAYHPNNMRKLLRTKKTLGDKEVYGSSLKLTDKDRYLLNIQWGINFQRFDGADTPAEEYLRKEIDFE